MGYTSKNTYPPGEQLLAGFYSRCSASWLLLSHASRHVVSCVMPVAAGLVFDSPHAANPAFIASIPRLFMPGKSPSALGEGGLSWAYQTNGAIPVFAFSAAACPHPPACPRAELEEEFDRRHHF